MSAFFYHSGHVMFPKFLRAAGSRYNSFATVQFSKDKSNMLFLLEPNSQLLVDSLWFPDVKDHIPLNTDATAQAILIRLKSRLVSVVEVKFSDKIGDSAVWRELQIGIARETEGGLFNCFGWSRNEVIRAMFLRAKQKKMPFEEITKPLMMLGDFKSSDYDVIELDKLIDKLSQKHNS